MYLTSIHPSYGRFISNHHYHLHPMPRFSHLSRGCSGLSHPSIEDVLPLIYHCYMRNMVSAPPVVVEAIRTKYEKLRANSQGPLIRIGPNELSFYSMDIYRTVNSVQTPFTKDPRVYGQFVQDEHPGLFSITCVILNYQIYRNLMHARQINWLNIRDPYTHSQRRRLMGQLFNRSKMNLMENMMTEKISKFIVTLYQYGSQPVSLVPACRSLEADIVCKIRNWHT